MQRVLFLVSGNNGLTQRAALALRNAGHSVRTAVVADGAAMRRATAPSDFDLIICPFLKTRIPESIWRNWPTIIVHPGPIGDRGPSSLDWAITRQEPAWGVTALAAVDEMDAGPIWASRTFTMPSTAQRKSSLYNGLIADAAVECILEVVARAADPTFMPTPLATTARPIPSARLRPTMTQADRSFSWDQSSDEIVRRIHAADGSPGVLARVGSTTAFVYDAYLAPAPAAPTVPGTIVSRRYGAVRVATGDGSVWIGHMRPRPHRPETRTCKLPAATVVAAPEFGVPVDELPFDSDRSYRDLDYLRVGDIGYLSFAFYNGAMSVTQCRRLLRAFQFAASQDTTVIVLQGGSEYFSNGIHLNVIEAAGQPAQAAWANIKAMNAVCRAVLTCTEQLVVGAFTGNAGAGGVMLPLGADIVVARDGIVLNPHYATMGLFGSELHTYTLPRRVGVHTAQRLTSDCLPIAATDARDIGLVDELGPRDVVAFDAWLAELATEYTRDDLCTKMRRNKEDVLRDIDKPLDAYETHELGEMTRDMFDDRSGFAEKRHRFVYKL